jgi:methyl-accepting chemotaxis protein
MGQQRTILSIRKETRQMFKKLNKMKIGARLKKSFRQIILIFGILSALVVVIMLYTINNYGTILDNYAYPQGDIAMAMNESAEVRAASRGIVGYDSDSLIESMKEQHEQAVKSFEEYLEKIRSTMITKEGTACMDAIDKAWAEYKEVDAKVIEVGATTDTAKSLQAQQMMTDEAAPKYQALDDALQKLMALNISLGNAKRAQLRTVMIAALTIIIIVIAVSTIYSNSLSVAISKSIEKPLNEESLKDRFITFAEGDIDSPLPTVESEDEIKELVSGVSAMSDRIRVIIKDSGRMLNEMSEGNFAIDTECEEVYTGAFTDLLTGIRKMNEEIDTTVRGVDDASGQVLTGSTNLAEAAQSLAEGATDQAASVEEMQATINELTSGIKTTAEELGTAYDEAYKYAEIAEGSRGDMEVLVQAMSRINETSEKIGAIITQIEDIASQTNLLSLNASIEAARAGEAGKGFAVVADQIRNLAEQSAKSAVDSKALIEAAIHEVGDGNMYAEKASTSLREVVDGIQAIADSAKKIKEISIEQADSMEQVEATAERIAEVVQNNSAAAQETSATSEELTAQATTLSGMVSVFKLRQ